MERVTSRSSGARNDITNRSLVEPAWPMGGMVSRNLADRQYDVQQFTGNSYSTVPGASYDRGVLYRYSTPVMQCPEPLPMLDPTSLEQYGANAYLYRTRSGR